MTIHNNYSPQDIIAMIKASKDKPVLVPDIAARFDTEENASVLNRRDSFKDITTRDADAGATLLNVRNDNVILKAVAPMALADCQVKGDFPFAERSKVLACAAPDNAPAAEATTPTNVHAGSLCSSALESKFVNPDDDHSAPNEDADEFAMDDEPVLVEETPVADDGLIDPNFYRMRVDLFDNGDVTNKTQWTAKMSCDVNPDSDPEDKYVIVANFYSRSRDFRGAVKKRDMWSEFYDHIEGMYEAKCKEQKDYKIKPMIAILKEEVKQEFGRPKYTPLAYTAAIMYQEHGKEPKVLVIYENFMQVVELNTKFTVQNSRSKLYKIGIYRDETRAHLEPKKETETKGMLKRDAAFFANR